jgi:ABC-type Mn2+/Zn2+ transport system permease subunit
VIGLLLSYYVGLAAGASIAGSIVAAYLAAIILSGLRTLWDRQATSNRLGAEVAS